MNELSHFPVMVNEAIRKLTKGNNGIKQNEKLAQYWHQRNDDDGEINLTNCSTVRLFKLLDDIINYYPITPRKKSNNEK